MSTTKPFASAKSTSAAVPLPTGGYINPVNTTPVRQNPSATLPASKSEAMMKSDAARMQYSIGGQGVGVGHAH